MKTHLNLLPPSYRRRRLIWRRLKSWCLVWGATAALAGGLFAVQYRQYASHKAERNARLSEYEPIRNMEREVRSLRGQIDELTQREALALSLTDEHPPLLVIAVISRAASRCGGDVYVRQLNLARDRASRGTRPGDRAGALQLPRSLTLQGLALSDAALLGFVEGLGREDVFHRVELKSSESSQAPNGRQARSYLIECLF